ncbi:Transketolase 2 [Raoultella terrigena]|uniref:Transketolase 2 n=1 Tax=Raoultella terrigena TaxID=577 RepID=A0A4U9CZM5_RAOTE|nr:Transketolase 2 [Raoultella terrigena]
MAALMKARQIMVYTHDSIGLGEDGPTHQAVEQLASLRLTPNFSTWRPCDQVETAVAWRAAIERQTGPTALILSRQNLAQMARTPQQVDDIARGGYVLKDAGGKPDLILIATGSEVEITALAAEKLLAKGVNVRVVSLRQPTCLMPRMRHTGNPCCRLTSAPALPLRPGLPTTGINTSA